MTFFRVWSVIFLITYLNSWGFIPIAVFWLVNVMISQKTIEETSENEKANSIWLMSFMGTFTPSYFRPKYEPKIKDKKRLISTQKMLFKYQCIASACIYIPSLLVCVAIVNMDSEFLYGSHVILDNCRFNICISVVMLEGMISTILSFYPTTSSIFRCCFSKYAGREISKNNAKGSRPKNPKERNVKSPKCKKVANPDSKSPVTEEIKRADPKGPLKDKESSSANKTTGVTMSEQTKKSRTKLDSKKSRNPYSGLPWHMYVRLILGCFMILTLVVLPILYCFDISLFSPALYEHTYMYFNVRSNGKPSNETIIIQVIPFPSTEDSLLMTFMPSIVSTLLPSMHSYPSHREISGAARKRKDTKSSEISSHEFQIVRRQFIKDTKLSELSPDEIQIMTRTTWKQLIQLNTNLTKSSNDRMHDQKPVAIIILDDQDIRPSSPIRNLGSISSDSHVHLYIVRKDDVKHVNDYLKNNQVITIVRGKRNIRNPMWNCTIPTGSCLTDHYRNGYIVGEEYRSMKCYYGDKTCYGFENDKQMSQKYCTDPTKFESSQNDVLCSLGDDGWTYPPKSFKISERTRTFRCTPTRCCSTTNKLEQGIPNCDRNETETTGWTHLLGNSSGYITPLVKRYCSLKDPDTEKTECIFEEQIFISSVSLNNL